MHLVKPFPILVFLIVLLGSIASSASDLTASVTNDIHFHKDGSGCLTITVIGSDFYSVANVFGLSKADLSTNSLDYYLKLALEKLHLKEKGKSLKTNATSVTFSYACSFSTPKSVLDWLDDNVLVPGKHIDWTSREIELQIRLSEQYDMDLTFAFSFDGYRITNANGVVMNSKRVLWHPGGVIKVLYLKAKRT